MNNMLKHPNLVKPAKKPQGIMFLDVFPVRWPSDTGPIEPKTFRRCGFGGAVIMDLKTGLFNLFGPDDVRLLCKSLRAAKRVIGYNCLNFDRFIIIGAGGRVNAVHWLDMYESILKQTRNSHSLSQLAEYNLRLKSDIALEEHWKQVRNQNAVWLLEKAVNGVIMMARIYNLVKEQGCLVMQHRITRKQSSVKISW